MITIRAAWDHESKVWYIEHSSLSGLHLEGDTIDGLREKIPGAIEDLLEGSGEREVPFELITSGTVKIAA
jgi:predicted RNase H-like HicB family nuclease